VDFVGKTLKNNGADCQWNDFCIEDPLSYWQVDELRMSGNPEIRYVEGYSVIGMDFFVMIPIWLLSIVQAAEDR